MFAPAIEKYLQEKVIFEVSREIWYHSEVKKWCDTEEEAIAEWEKLTGFKYSRTAYADYLRSVNYRSDSYEFFEIRARTLSEVIQNEVDSVKRNTIYEESKAIETRAENSIRMKVREELRAEIKKALRDFL